MPTRSETAAKAKPASKARRGPKFLEDLAILLTGQFGAKLIALLSFTYLARVLDPASYGAVEFVVGLAGLATMVVDLGLSKTGVRRAHAAPAERSQLAAQIFLIQFAVSLVCALAMVIGVNVFGGTPVLRGLVALYAVSLLVNSAYQEWLLQSAGLMARVAIAQILRVAVTFAVILAVVHGVGDTVLVGAAEIAGVAAAVMFALYVQSAKIARVRLWTRFEMSLIREALPIGAGTMIGSAAQYVPLFLMGALVGGDGAGLFAGANRIAASLGAVSFVYHFNLYSIASRLATERAAALRALMRGSFRASAWVTIGGALMVSVASMPIVTTMFGPQFRSAAGPLAILIWTVPGLFLSGHARWSLILARSDIEVFRSQVAGLLTVAVLGLALVPTFSATGAAIAAVGGNLGVLISSHALARRRGVATPSLLLATKPLLLAGVLILGTALVDLPVWGEALGSLVLYTILAPALDRSLVSDVFHLAHAGGHGDSAVE